MWTRKLLKDNAKIAFKRNYWLCVIVTVIAGLLGASTTSTIEYTNEQSDTSGYESVFPSDFDATTGSLESDYLDVLEPIFTILASPVFIITAIIVFVIVLMFAILVSNAVKIGHKRYYMENREHKSSVGQLFYSFREGRYGNAVWTMFCMDLYIFGWSLLFFIPGIIKSFSYMMVPYILADNAELSKSRAIEISRNMMDGHKWDAFVLGLSFIGWQMLNTITAGLLGIFWVNPYMDATYAEFYAAIKAEAFQRGITDSVELPGFALPEFAQQTVEF